MVELSVIMPVLFVLALGTFEIGRGLQHHHIITKGVRDAGRFLARTQATCPSAGTDVGSIVNATDVTRAQNLALSGDVNGGTARIDYWTVLTSVAVEVDCFDNSAITFRQSRAASDTEIATIRVIATVTYQDLGFLAILGLPAITFVVDHEQVHIGE